MMGYRKREREPSRPASGGEITDHYGPQESVSVPEPAELKGTACATCGGTNCKLRADNALPHAVMTLLQGAAPRGDDAAARRCCPTQRWRRYTRH